MITPILPLLTPSSCASHHGFLLHFSYPSPSSSLNDESSDILLTSSVLVNEWCRLIRVVFSPLPHAYSGWPTKEIFYHYDLVC
ncbi:hypothetical protein L873DRAFT_769076 [Choiromyces venosus 120613-1]|uniref:Uncharacterized protein n=1 Tax=Choiromyces venosus 120613-1 TaxID=1336337 RepID=A0A3N4ISL2_9PEZI|nr:hypothetical protein L873DRAFT_769076 [Choiromyces venosus 120613-1]